MDCTLTTEERWVVCGTTKMAVCMGKRGKIPHTMLYPCLKGHGPIEASFGSVVLAVSLPCIHA